MKRGHKIFCIFLLIITSIGFTGVAFEEQRRSSQKPLQNRTQYSANIQKNLQPAVKRNKMFGKSPVALTDGSGGYTLDKNGNEVLKELDGSLMQQIADRLKGKYICNNTAKTRNAADIIRKKRWEERFKYIIGFAVFLLVMEVFFRKRWKP